MVAGGIRVVAGRIRLVAGGIRVVTRRVGVIGRGVHITGHRRQKGRCRTGLLVTSAVRPKVRVMKTDI